MEKFEYWTILVGGVLMIATGFILWLPTLDTSIFTGYISRERMLREHPLELARIEGVAPEEQEWNGSQEKRDRTVEAPAK
jgi:hypothetical protein